MIVDSEPSSGSANPRCIACRAVSGSFLSNAAMTFRSIHRLRAARSRQSRSQRRAAPVRPDDNNAARMDAQRTVELRSA